MLWVLGFIVLLLLVGDWFWFNGWWTIVSTVCLWLFMLGYVVWVADVVI